MLEQLVQETIAEYTQRYGTSPKWLVRAPGRVNLIGEHTDYNDGFVFPMAIERYTVIAAGPNTNGTSTMAKIYSRTVQDENEVLLDGTSQPSDKVRWISYIQGTIACMLEKGVKVPSFNAVVSSNVPLGGGLSSSASLEVAVATLMEDMTGQTIDPVEKALVCQKAEHEYAKMPCGIMDQFISAMGKKDHAMLLDCRSHQPTMIPLADPSVVVLVTNSNVKHQLTGSEYPERRQACEKAAEILGVSKLRDVTKEMLEAAKDKLIINGNDTVYRRARHVIGEDVRTKTMAAALQSGDWDTVGEQMYASHFSLRDDYEVSCSEIDILVDIARSIGKEGGVIGSRITGGGFGGCTVSLVRADCADSVMAEMARRYREQTGIEPFAFLTRPADGAVIMD